MVTPAVNAEDGIQFGSASNRFQAAAVLVAATGMRPPQLLQALLKTAPQPAILQSRSLAAVHKPSAAAAKAPLPQPVALQPAQLAALRSARDTATTENAGPCTAAGPGGGQPPQLQSTAAPAEAARSGEAALPVAGQLLHLRPAKMPSRIVSAQEGASSGSALQAAVPLSQAQWLSKAAASTADPGSAQVAQPSAPGTNCDEVCCR